MEQLDQSLSTLINKLQAAGFEQAPEVIAGAIRAIYWDGIMQLGTAIILFVLFLCFIGGIFMGLRENRTDDSVIFISSLGAICTGLMASISLLSGNLWLKVFDPQAALYQQIMKGIL